MTDALKRVSSHALFTKYQPASVLLMDVPSVVAQLPYKLPTTHTASE